MTSKQAIGIDLGTTFSVVAHLDNEGRPWTVPNAEGDLTTPSAVFFDRAGPIVGKEAVKAAEFEPDRVARFVKREMGEARCERAIGGQALPPTVIQALVLRKLKQDAEEKLGPIAQAVITVPAYFNEPRRKATQDAGRLAGLQVLDIINEPTAAAIAYGVQRGFLTPQGKSEQAETILVYDLGGGTFDVTLMEIQGRRYTAIATAGDVRLGGIDWDGRIVDFVAEQFASQHGADPRHDEATWQTLMQQAAEAKHALTAREEVQIPVAVNGKRMRVALSRERFESLTGDLLDRTEFTIDRLMRDAGRSWSDVTRLLLAGGSTRMPMVRRMLEAKTGLPADRSLSPDEAVAHGAAIYAGLILEHRGAPRQGMSFTNVNSHDLGVLAIEPDTGMRRRRVLIPRNTPLPAAGVADFVTQQDGQRNVKVSVIEGGDATGAHATHIGKCVVADLPPGQPAKSPVRVAFDYASNGRLSVGAALPGTGRHDSVVIIRSSGLSEQALTAWQARIESGRLLDQSESDETIMSQAEASDDPEEAITATGESEPGCGVSQQGSDDPELATFLKNFKN